MRGSGVAVIGAGTVIFTVSLNAIQKNNEIRKEHPQQRGNGLADLGRAFGVFLGGVWIAGGTTMTIIANRKLDKIKNISVTSDGNSVGLVYKF